MLNLFQHLSNEIPKQVRDDMKYMTTKKTPAKNEKKLDAMIKDTVAELLEKMTVAGSVEVVGDMENGFQVTIQTEETGLLIGHHGEVINGLQLLLGVILYKKQGEWIRVIVDVGDYRKGREENIKAMVNRIVEEVTTTAQEVALPPMTPLERRIVHTMLTDHPSVTSQSFGEGRDRRVTIKPR
jgi:spoIIIJ-associated protein